MKTHFRLYTDTKMDFNSSIFDLIHGDKETKQTKGLAYIFSQYNDFLFSFLEFKTIKESIAKCIGRKFDCKQITAIEVSAERLTTDKKRADIVIKIDTHKKPLIALIIEAKSIKVNINQQNLSNQILNYLTDTQFPELYKYKKAGIVLTKYKQSIPNIASITWEEIIQILENFCKSRKEPEIINQYFKFLTQIDNTMKYYEKEVLSIPAGKSLHMVQKFNIYECPDNKDYNYRKALFITFRQSNGGEMSKLYKLEDIVILNPANENEIEALKNSTFPENFKNRLLEYIKKMNYPANLEEDRKFYILSESETIDLLNKPRPPRNNAKFTYYTLKEILTKKEVIPESQQ